LRDALPEPKKYRLVAIIRHVAKAIVTIISTFLVLSAFRLLWASFFTIAPVSLSNGRFIPYPPSTYNPAVFYPHNAVSKPGNIVVVENPL